MSYTYLLALASSVISTKTGINYPDLDRVMSFGTRSGSAVPATNHWYRHFSSYQTVLCKSIAALTMNKSVRSVNGTLDREDVLQPSRSSQ